MDIGRTYPTKVRPGSSRLVGMRLSDFQVLVQPRALCVGSLIPTPRVAPPPSRHCRIHGSRASLLRLNMTFAVCARTASPPMPFPDALNNARTATQTENTRDSAREDTPHAHTVSMASRPRKTEGEEQEEVQLELRMPRSFDFWGSWQRCAT